jgi:hypothetical protein
VRALIASALLALLLLRPAGAYNELPPAQLLFVPGANVQVSDSATNYFGLVSKGTTEANFEYPVAIACTASAIYVHLGAAVTGSGSSYKFTLDDNSSATAVTVTVSSGANSASAGGFAVAVNAGDLIDVSAVPQASPTNSPAVSGVAVSCQ